MRYNSFSGVCDLHTTGAGRDYIEKVMRRPGWKPQEVLPSDWAQLRDVGLETFAAKRVKPRPSERPCRVCGKLIQGQCVCGTCRKKIRHARGETKYICPRCGEPKNNQAAMCLVCFGKLEKRGPYDKG